MTRLQSPYRCALLAVFTVVLATATLGAIAEIFQRTDNADAKSRQAIGTGEELLQKMDDLESEVEDLKDQINQYRYR